MGDAQLAPGELGRPAHDVVSRVRDAGVAAVLRAEVHRLPHKLLHHIARVVLHPVTLSAHRILENAIDNVYYCSQTFCQVTILLLSFRLQTHSDHCPSAL